MLERAKHIIVFEADNKWLKPLAQTFAQYKDKVRIIPQFVSDENSGVYTTLDAEFSGEIGIDIIKMDVEGAEINVIRGAKEINATYHDRFIH